LILHDIASRYSSDGFVDAARMEHAYSVLANISPLLRRTVEAVYAENASVTQVAAELGIGSGQVREFLVRGLHLLRVGLSSNKKTETDMDPTMSEFTFSAARWRAELRKTVRRLVTPAVIQ